MGTVRRGLRYPIFLFPSISTVFTPNRVANQTDLRPIYYYRMRRQTKSHSLSWDASWVYATNVNHFACLPRLDPQASRSNPGTPALAYKETQDRVPDESCSTVAYCATTLLSTDSRNHDLPGEERALAYATIHIVGRVRNKDYYS